jgi:predicted phage tail protein
MHNPPINVQVKGILGREFTDNFVVHCRNYQDPFNYLEANFPGFRKRIIELEERGTFYILKQDKKPVPVDLLFSEVPSNVELALVPLAAGSGKFGSIITGLIAIGVGIATGGSAAPIIMGALSVIGGIAQMLMPRRKQDKDDPKKKSSIMSSFNQGQRPSIVPIAYGSNQWLSGVPVSGVVSTKTITFDETDD